MFGRMLERLRRPENLRGFLVWWVMMTAVFVLPDLIKDGHVGVKRVVTQGFVAAVGGCLMYGLPRPPDRHSRRPPPSRP